MQSTLKFVDLKLSCDPQQSSESPEVCKRHHLLESGWASVDLRVAPPQGLPRGVVCQPCPHRPGRGVRGHQGEGTPRVPRGRRARRVRGLHGRQDHQRDQHQATARLVASL